MYTSSWNFQHQDFQVLIAEAEDEDFIYCDPPYLGRHVDYFNSWSEKDEYNLFLSLEKTRAKFILSTWHSNKYRVNTRIDEYRKQFYILKKEHFYHVGAKEENRNSIIEALVLNYEPPISNPEELEAKQLILMEPRAPYHVKT
jgi:DNA adenine methylase